MTGQQSDTEGGWLRRDEDPADDDAGSVVLAWRTAAGRTQTDVAGWLGTTQQHLSQIETGSRPVPLELRRKMVTELGIAAEDLGLIPARRMTRGRLCWRGGQRPGAPRLTRPPVWPFSTAIGSPIAVLEGFKTAIGLPMAVSAPQ